MNLRIPLLSAALVSLLLSSPASATTHTNLLETFDSCSGKWSSSTGFNLTGWEKTSGSIYSGEGGARIGTSSAAAVLTSPTIPVMNPGTEATVTIRLQAAAYSGQAGSLLLMVIDAASGVTNKTWTTDLTSHSSTEAVVLDDSDDNLWFDFSYKATNNFRLAFTSARTSGNATKRVLLGYLLVTENLPVLSIPDNLATDSDAGENDFTVAWDAVTGATGYSVKLFDATGENELDTVSCSSSETTATFSGLTSSTHYIVSVVALGNHTTTDDSVPATLDVTTAASSATAPTLDVSVTSWTAGVAGTSAVSATLEGGIDCTVASVSMSDGSSATVANGTLSWTPPVSATASSVTATFHVTHGTDGWDLTQVLSVAATPAPGAPSVTLSGATPHSFNASWSATAGGPIVSYKIRAWTGRETPDDATGGGNENFEQYLSDKTVPDGWIFENTKTPYNQEENPVDFRNNNEWIATPDYGGTITSISFRLRRQSENGSTLKVYGSTGSNDPAVWKTEENTLATLNPLVTQVYTISVDSSKGISRVFFQYTKASGNVSIGTFSVSGTDWPAADFLEGWGGAKVSVGTSTSQTFSNPVVGTVNYVEVTAIGPTGLSAATIESVSIPRAPAAVISVK